MNPYLKTIIVLSARVFLRLGYIFPVKKNRIIFSSYEGMQYTCNPKYIFEGIHSKYGDKYEYIWALNDSKMLPEIFIDDVKTVKYLSIKHIYYLLTSGTLVSNLGIEPILPKRKKQIFINTWHGGGAYKVVSSDMNMFSKSERFYIRQMRKIRKKGTDIFLSSCRKFTEISSRDFDIDVECFVPSGMPRNDRFFHTDDEKKVSFRKLFLSKYNIPEDNLLVLYAPTFRGSHRKQACIDNDVCSKRIENSLKERFGKPVTFLFRSHISKGNTQLLNADSDVHAVNLTKYPDMQDLLEVSDVLITDYSSSIWDYCITGKPGFLYTPDLKEYLADRGFYTSIDSWPYPYANTIRELCECITRFDDYNNRNKIIIHQNDLGSYENGNAIEMIVDIICTNNQ